MSAALAAVGGALLFLLKAGLLLLGAVLALAALALLCPFCADVSWENETLRVRAGACGLTFPVWQYPAPAPPPAEEAPTPPRGLRARIWAKLRAWRAERKRRRAEKKAARKPKTEAPPPPKEKAKLTLDILCTVLRGAGRLMRAVFGALRFTHIRIYLPVGGGEPDAAARAYGKANAWLYPALGFLDRFFYLDFDELRLAPQIDPDAPAQSARVSFRVSARLLFVVIAAAWVLAEFWREKVLDVFL